MDEEYPINVLDFRLHHAVEKNDEEMVRRLLINEPPEMNQKDNDGRTPVFVAAENDCIKCLQLLIERNADLNEPNKDGSTPAFIALEKKAERCAKALIKKNAEVKTRDDNPSELHKIVTSGNIKQLEDYLKREKYEINVLNKMQKTPLHLAVKRGELEMVKLLIEKKADVNKADICNMLPIHEAALSKNKLIIKLLLQNGADLASENIGGLTGLDIIFRDCECPGKLLLDVLDSQIANDNNSADGEIKFDFKIFSPLKDVQTQVTSKLLTLPNKVTVNEIFDHPLLQVFITLKQKKSIYIWSFVIELIFLLVHWLFLYRYLIFLKHPGCKELAIARIITWILTPLRMTFGLLQFLTLTNTWFTKFSILVNVVTPAIVMIILAFELVTNVTKSYDMMSKFITYLMSLTSLLICMEPFLLLSRLSKFKNYIQIFYAISKRVLSVFVVVLSVLVGFATTFHILLDHYKEFSTFGTSFFKTVVMMTGEFDYDDIFQQYKDSVWMVDKYVPRFIFIIFINLIHIVVGNFMIGQAVEDIRTLEEKSSIKKLKRQAAQMEQFEKFFKGLDNILAFSKLKTFSTKCLKWSYLDPSQSLTIDDIYDISPDLLRSIERILERNPKMEATTSAGNTDTNKYI